MKSGQGHGPAKKKFVACRGAGIVTGIVLVAVLMPFPLAATVDRTEDLERAGTVTAAAEAARKAAEQVKIEQQQQPPPPRHNRPQSPKTVRGSPRRCVKNVRVLKLRPMISKRSARRPSPSVPRMSVPKTKPELRKIAAAPPPRTATKIELGKSSSRRSRSREPIASRSTQYVNRRRRCAAFIGRLPTFRLLAPSSGAGSGGREIGAAVVPAVVSRYRDATRCRQVTACGAFRGGIIIPACSMPKSTAPIGRSSAIRT